MVKINMNKNIGFIELYDRISHLNGSKIIISKSKIKKIIPIVKNRKDKFFENFEKMSNPHSNMLIFSVVIVSFILIVIITTNKIIVNRIVIIDWNTIKFYFPHQ